MKSIRILIADDHDVVRSGLRALLSRTAGFNVVAEASDGEEALQQATRHKPDVAILDLSMPKLNGVDTTRAIKEANPDIKVLVLTIHESEEYVWQVIRAGANGYLLKTADKDELAAAVNSVADGQRFFSPSVSELIIDEFANRMREEDTPKPRAGDLLTRRETEVLRLIAYGWTNKEVAAELFLSARTINTHRSNLMRKLDIHDTAGLVRYAIQVGIVEVDK